MNPAHHLTGEQAIRVDEHSSRSATDYISRVLSMPTATRPLLWCCWQAHLRKERRP